jgi:hypothetical protein
MATLPYRLSSAAAQNKYPLFQFIIDASGDDASEHVRRLNRNGGSTPLICTGNILNTEAQQTDVSNEVEQNAYTVQYLATYYVPPRHRTDLLTN